MQMVLEEGNGLLRLDGEDPNRFLTDDAAFEEFVESRGGAVV
jgi:hypothetical protein